jgi:hypothetical protein
VYVQAQVVGGWVPARRDGQPHILQIRAMSFRTTHEIVPCLGGEMVRFASAVRTIRSSWVELNLMMFPNGSPRKYLGDRHSTPRVPDIRDRVLRCIKI